MKVKQDILDNINATSIEAIDFLNQKDNDIKNQEGNLICKSRLTLAVIKRNDR